jgi:type II secretory ATPase GspE/PulE/Tfp pilus assembly ATPase PilB-like protein
MKKISNTTHTAIDVRRVVADRAALKLVSARNAQRWGVLPLSADENTLHVVLADEENETALIQLESQTGLTVNVLPASDSGAVTEAIRRYYVTEVSENAGTPLGLLEELTNRAMQIRCSDIHVDPESRRGCVRMRVDGVMRIERELSLMETADIVSAIKVAASLDIAERRMPQDGQLTLFSLGEEISMRVATVPTICGEKVTLRILATAAISADLAHLDDLGMSPAHFRMMHDVLAHPNGVILLSGPTGSGKTTTLYAALRHLQRPGTQHILSIEDPVEVPLDGINQVHVDAERVSFNKSLRSALRHDPDIIMIGEIRDAETADTAVKSALTGHLVLSTVHANSAAGVVTRLLNLGVTPELLAASLRLIIAQRLVRRPCRHCCAAVRPDEDVRREFDWDPDAQITIPKAVGCPLCAGSGYAGRLGLYEMIPFGRRLRDMTRQGAQEDAIARAVFDVQGLATLRRDGADKVLQGLTTAAEVRRVVLLEEDA